MLETFLSVLARSEQPLLGCSVTMSSLMSAKLIARAGFSWVLIEMEHSPQSPETVTNIVHAVVAASGGSCYPLVRVPSHGVEWIKWALDSGAAGIIIPMVNNATEMRSIIDRAVYPQIGSRSFGPVGAPFASTDPTYTTEKYVDMAQKGGIAIIPMIETKEGVENAEEILAVEGVNAAFIGPKDLKMSLQSRGSNDDGDDHYRLAVERILTAGKKAQLPVGSVGVGATSASVQAQAGIKFILCGLDRAGLVAGITQQLQSVQRALPVAS